MEPLEDCLSCNELNKCLQVEKKKVSQKNRLISLLRELVKSYETKDLNLTFNDLSQIYESSANEVSILKQRLSLYLDENQELLQSKNELISQKDCLEKKCHDIEVELSHLRFVNKQLGDYYREKEANHNQYKDRLKKLARKLLSYEPKNIEARKILNLQNLPVESDSKPLKLGNKKKEEVVMKDMEKDLASECDDSVKITEVPVLEEDASLSSLSGSLNDLTEDSNFICNEEDLYTPASVPVKDKTGNSTRTTSDSLVVSNSIDNNISVETCIVVNTVESDNLASKPLSPLNSDSSDNFSFLEKMPSCNSNVEIVNQEKSISVINENTDIRSDLNSETGKNDDHPKNIPHERAFDHDCNDSNDSFECENSLPDLISPLKSDGFRILNGFLSCETAPKNLETKSKEMNHCLNLDKSYNESADIKNEVFSNSSDPVGRSRKSSDVRSKYKHLNDGSIFNGKPVKDTYSHLTGNYSTDYQFSGPQYISCCNNTCGSKPPIFLKLYNCSNIDINIPSSVEKEGIPVITVKDKKGAVKNHFRATDYSSKPNIYSYRSNSTKVSTNKLAGYNNVLNLNDKFLYERNHHINSNPFSSTACEQKDSNELECSDYYFLDYLSKNEDYNKCSNFKKYERNNIVCNRIFPVQLVQPYDLDLFCLCFQNLKMNHSTSENSFPKANVELNSSLSSISKPPIFHNVLPSSSINSYDTTNKWIFGQTLDTKNCMNKQEVNKQLTLKPSSLVYGKNNKFLTKPEEKLNKFALNSITNGFNGDNSVKKNCLKQDIFHNNYDKILKKTECGATKRLSSSIGYEVVSKKRKKVKISEDKDTKMLHLGMCSMVDGTMNLADHDISIKQKPLSPLNSDIPPVIHKKNGSSPQKFTDKVKSMCDVDKDTDVSTSTSDHHSKKKSTPCESPLHSQLKVKFQPLNSERDKIKSIFDMDKDNDVSTSTLLNDYSLKKQNPCESPVPSQLKVKFQPLNSGRASVESKPFVKKDFPTESDSDPKEKEVSVINFKTPKPLGFKKSKEIEVISKNIVLKTDLDQKVKANKFEYIPNQAKETNVDQKKNSKTTKDKEKNSVNNVIKVSAHNKLPKKAVNLGCKHKLSLSLNKEKVNNETPHLSTSCDNKKHIMVCNKEEDSNCDNELLEIFKESLLDPAPLLSPLRRTPELNIEEKSHHHEAMGLAIVSEGDKVRDNSNDRKDESESISSPEKGKEDLLLASYFQKSKEKSIDSNEKVLFMDLNMKNENCNNKQDALCEPVDFKSYNIFSDNEDELSKTVNFEMSQFREGKSLLDKEEENNPENEAPLKFKAVRSYVPKRNKNLPVMNKNETDNTSTSTLTSNIELEENITSTVEENKPSVINCNTDSDLSSSFVNEKDEKSNSGCNSSSISLGFYVNRSDIEPENNLELPSSPTLKDVECSEPLTPENTKTLDESSSDKFNNSELNGGSEAIGDVEDNGVLSLNEEQERPIKRKKIDNEQLTDESFFKKEINTLNYEHISCETDVFICALKYLSAEAISTDDKNKCSNQKPDPDASLISKIAINHIKNLIYDLKGSSDYDNYCHINQTVQKILGVKEASAVTLAKSIIEAITESDEKEEVKTRAFIPSMTKTVKLCLLIAVSFIGYKRDFVMEFLEVFELYISSFYDKSLTIKEGCRLVVFYTAFCRSYNLDYKVKYLIYDVLYTRNIKAYPMVYRIIQTWPDVMPDSKSCSSRECLLTQTIIYILLSGTSSIDEKLEPTYCTGSIRLYLQKHFGYDCIGINKNDLADKIIDRITAGGGSLALVLLCKCEPWEWACTVIEKKLFPILRTFKNGQMDEITLCEYILTVGRIVRGFPITKAAYIVKNALEIFEAILHDSNNTHLAEIVIEAISLLRRHNLMQCTSILMHWKPNNEQVTVKTLNHIKTILMVKNVLHWKHVYLINSAVPNQNKRAIRSKRKS